MLKVTHGTVRHAQDQVGENLEVERATDGRQGEGVLARRNGLVILAEDREGVAQIASDPSEPLRIVQPLG